MRVKFTRTAARNLDTILAHIAAERPAAAREFAREFQRQIHSLSEFPQLGRAGRLVGIRELVLHENYLACYRVREETIEIVRVLHAKRRFP